MRLRDSGLVELLLAILACIPFFLLFADYEWVIQPSLVMGWQHLGRAEPGGLVVRLCRQSGPALSHVSLAVVVLPLELLAG